MNDNPPSRSRPWFPFSWAEIEIGITLVAAAGGLASFLSTSSDIAIAAGGSVALILYLAGLFVHATDTVRTFDFLEGGALRGEGYIPHFRRATRSLFLTHVDDDAPSEELLAIYRTLLDRGVEMRRVLFLRPGGVGTTWVARFGRHERLLQRAIPADRAEVMRLSFAVVDEETVIMSLPGFSHVENADYAREYVLRHLIVMHDPAVARVFLRMHEDLWGQAASIAAPEELADV